MIGLEELRKEMIKRGCNNAQVDSKVAAIVVDILSEDPNNTAEAIWNNERMLHETHRRVEYLRKKRQEEQESAERMLKQAREEREAIKRYVDEFRSALAECDTDEGRDTLRKAQMFVNSVDVHTKYDNTAYIAGLAAILSSDKVSALAELKKINPKVQIPEY